MTKDEVYESVCAKHSKEKGENTWYDFPEDVADDCMSIYAKQEAIEFCEWMQRYTLYYYSKKPYTYRGRQSVNGGRGKTETWTAEQLYELYQQSKSNIT